MHRYPGIARVPLANVPTGPNVTAPMPLLTAGSGDERFAFGLQLMINGLLNTEPPQI